MPLTAAGHYDYADVFWNEHPSYEWPITGCSVDCANHVLRDEGRTQDLSGGLDHTQGTNATISAAAYPHGQVNGDTLRAVRFASLETRRPWAVAQQQIIKTSGQAKGEKMICALTKDDPVKACS